MDESSQPRGIATFEDLDVWKFSVQLRKNISSLVKSFPAEEKFRLADQMIRAFRSVTANIAEGFGRFHFQESIQFCRQARGSLYELFDHLHVALEEGYLSKDKFEKLREDVLRATKVLNGYIRYLANSKQKQLDE